ncbi:DUF2071 domain-containing protein [Chryseobacterium turcicum]|uniref:DUF2071 domain-containing protein n=1 Tax=Chryseobacterium turcicum TaxID=2898076 RepID=A0A9Q3V7K8_9FLAO|nr:DUF2071 domain-containing protein [Chryseobacterium turcicum]MCD1118600.1 DUF2071 domain-containing protein [Chryseobacterium turcicum]
MKIPTIHGIIERRMLINYVAEPEFVAKILPKPFRPKLYNNKAIVGICLIRLKNIKPKGLPNFLGVNSENGAHRIAVEWDENGETKEGVFIPRRDTSLKLNAIVGGKIFPGKHYLAKFNVLEQNNHFHLDFTSSDNTTIEIDAKLSDKLNENSIFQTLDNVSEFFEKGSIGYSPNGKDFDGLQLETYKWEVKPLEVENVKSSFFEDKDIFPEGSIKFDNAILMENIEHEWKSLKSINHRC